jgi:hypothetical protein
MPLLFPLPPSGTDAVHETPAYLTNVLTSYDGHEQRIQLRGLPQLSLEYEVAATTPGRPADASRAQLLAALLEAGGAGDYVVPLWHLPRLLSAPAAMEATSLSAGLAGLPRFPQGATYQFMLWNAQSGAAEAVTASAWTDTTITLLSPTVTTLAWPAGTQVFPALTGHLADAPGRERRGPHRLRGRVAFDLDLLGSAYAPGAHTSEIYTPAGYLSLDVLTGLPCALSPPGEIYNRRVTVVGTAPGIRTPDAQDGAAGWTRQLLVKCRTAAEIEALRAFLDARRGRAVPFWLPTWDEDLTLVADAEENAASFDIRNPQGAGYAGLLQPLGPHRRHLQFHTPGQVPFHLAVGGTEDQGSGVATVELQTHLPQAITTACRVSYLRYVRLDTDAPVIEHYGPEYARCQFPVREIPLECPA